MKIFKGEYNKKLGKDYDKFIDNLVKDNRLNNNIIRLLNDCKNFEDFIINAFHWSESFEAVGENKETAMKNGTEYWRKISKR